MVTTNQQTYEKEKREMEQNHQSQVVYYWGDHWTLLAAKVFL